MHKVTMVYQELRSQTYNPGITWSLGVLVAKKYYSELTQLFTF